ncbi:MAG: thioesterase [Colwellia sp.]|nr:thioesterase [Colwellia sp.]
MNQWIVKPRPLHNPEIKLLCFPYAGGGVPVYFPWKNKLGKNVELNIVQLPGRGTHFSQAPIDNMETLVESLLPAVSDILDGNYVIFGHSVGSRIGFELVRQAMAKGFPAPLHFFASGSSSPKHKCLENKVHELPDNEFIKELKDMDGTPSEVLENRELMELFLPTLRADFKIAEQYTCHEKFIIPTTITVLSGRDDNISSEQLQMWGDFSEKSEVVMFDGGHFFIDTNKEQVIDIVCNRLEDYLHVPA